MNLDLEELGKTHTGKMQEELGNLEDMDIIYIYKKNIF